MPESQKRNFPKIQVTLTPETLGIVDGLAETLTDPGESRNRSLAIRHIIREWFDARRKSRKKSRQRA